MKLSATQQGAFDRIRADGGRIERLPGGFWTTPSTPRRPKPGAGYVVPDWSVGTQTVEALAKKGLIEESRRAPNGHFGFAVEYRVRAAA